MVDVVDQKTRSRMMSGIRSKNTKPELLIRKGLHGRGFRFRLHDKRLPGKPDLVFPKYSAVIFVHGCFWHMHDCHLFKWPKTRREFWHKKLLRNQEKDVESYASLKKDGWYILTIWECALKGRTRRPMDKVLDMAADWLVSGQRDRQIKGGRPWLGQQQ
jgi:DNA mismatch endonuclease (patch repair protein)